MLYFTPYRPLPLLNDTRDLLGFQTVRSRLTDKFYPQFTVYSTSPGALGFFCWAVGFLDGRGCAPGRDDAARFRDVEILLGCMAAGASSKAIPNISRYSRIPGNATLSEASSKYRYALYSRLGYGIRAFYRSMAVKWGLLKGGRLTESGVRLARAWDARAGEGCPSFTGLARRWLDGDPLDRLWQACRGAGRGRPSCGAASGTKFPFDCFAPAVGYWGAEEQKVWNDILNDYCLNHPDERPLWESPPPKEITGLLDQEAKRHDFFARLGEFYGKHEHLAGTFAACAAFERFAALVQFVFEREFASASLGSRPKAMPAGLGAMLAEAVPRASAELERRLDAVGEQSWPLCRTLMEVRDDGALRDAVIEHHMEHQKKKGSQAYLSHGGVLRKVEIAKPAERLALDGPGNDDAEALIRRLVWIYRSDWFFRSASLWARAAGRIA